MSNINELNHSILELKNSGLINTKEISDGHHSFGEYIDMRNRLFIALCNAYPNLSWKSKQHFQEEFLIPHDGSPYHVRYVSVPLYRV